MKRRNQSERYEAWLEAEERGDEAAADAAMAALFAQIPLESPSPGFAAATMVRVREERAAAPRLAEAAAPAPAARWAAAVLALLSAATLGLSVAAVEILPRLPVGDAVSTFNRLVAALWKWIASGITLWSEAAEWSELLARVVAVPGVAGSLVAVALAAAIAFSLLRRILLNDLLEKEPIYAERH